MMRSDYRKKGAICAACLIVGIVCTVFSLRVLAAEDNGMPQPSSAKIYSSMSDSSDIIANLIVGNVFDVVGAENDGDGGIWYRVRADFGVEGYVKAGELDRLIMDAQAMQQLPPSESANDTAGEDAPPEGDDAEAEPLPEGDDAGAEPLPEDDNAGAEPSSADSNAGEEVLPDSVDAGEIPVTEDGGSAGEEGLPGDEDILEEPAEGAVPEFENRDAGEESVDGGEPVDGAGFGIVSDGWTEESATIGNEGFTIIERSDQAKGQRHGRIDAVLIMIVTGGILCIIAIAVLAKRIRICLGTEG